MCGRYTLTANADTIIKRFKINDYKSEHSPRYNIAPSQNNPVVLVGKKLNRIMATMRWGLIPYWAKDEKIGYKMINARVETVAEKPSFKNSLLSRRCLVPADGYYEWPKSSKPRKRPPYRIVLKSRELFAFAGLWDAWRNPEDRVVHSYTIITTQADELVGKIHPRMPIIIRPENENHWIDPSIKNLDAIMMLLDTYPSNLTEMYEVSPLVGRANLDSEDFIRPVR